jgi:hypothetical protein
MAQTLKVFTYNLIVDRLERGFKVSQRNFDRRVTEREWSCTRQLHFHRRVPW